MKTIEATVPQKQVTSQVKGLYIRFAHNRIEGKSPLRTIQVKLTSPIDGETSIVFNPGEPGYDDMASALDIEAAMTAALKKRFKDATIKDIPMKATKTVPEKKATTKKSSKK